MKKIFLAVGAFVLVGILVFALILPGCAKKKAPAEIRVGVVQAQTGMFAGFGRCLWNKGCGR
jgi:hypothetical protein